MARVLSRIRWLLVSWMDLLAAGCLVVAREEWGLMPQLIVGLARWLWDPSLLGHDCVHSRLHQPVQLVLIHVLDLVLCRWATPDSLRRAGRWLLLLPDLLLEALVHSQLLVVVWVEGLPSLWLVEMIRLLRMRATGSSTLIVQLTATEATVLVTLGIVAVLESKVPSVIAKRRAVLILL